MCPMNVEGLTGTPARNIPGLIHGCWRRMKQARVMGKQTRKKVENMFEGKPFRSGMEHTNIESLLSTYY